MDYERIPWILDAGTVRITFDSDVRAAIGSYDIFDTGLPALSVLEPGKLILEVKFTEMLPSFYAMFCHRQQRNLQQFPNMYSVMRKPGI